MRRSLILGLAALCHMAASAQTSVRVYGIVDAAIDYVSSATPGHQGMTRVTSGGANTSRWGIRGREDLGGGLAALFQLEGTFLADSGSSDGALFKRHAWVGLEGGFGRIALGRSFTTVHDLVTLYDPMALAQFYSWSVSASATGPNKYAYTTSFDNMVKYQGTWGPVQLGINYGAGEQPGTARDGARVALSLAGQPAPLGWMATWEQVNGSSAGNGRRDTTTVAHAGILYQLGPVKWTMALRHYRLAPADTRAATTRAVTSWTGINYTPDTTTWTAALYHVHAAQAGAAADPTMLVLSSRRALSPQADIYVALAIARGRHGQAAGVLRDLVSYANEQHGLATGIQYRY